jgi:hypothetical protein
VEGGTYTKAINRGASYHVSGESAVAPGSYDSLREALEATLGKPLDESDPKIVAILAMDLSPS